MPNLYFLKTLVKCLWAFNNKAMKQVTVKEWGKERIQIGGVPHTLVHEDDMEHTVGNMIIGLNDQLIKSMRDLLEVQEQLNTELKKTKRLYEHL